MPWLAFTGMSATVLLGATLAGPNTFVGQRKMESYITSPPAEAVFVKVTSEGVTPLFAKNVHIGNVHGKNELGAAPHDVRNLLVGQRMIGQGAGNGYALPGAKVVKPSGRPKADLGIACLDSDSADRAFPDRYVLRWGLSAVGEIKPRLQHFIWLEVCNVDLVDGEICPKLAFGGEASDCYRLIGRLRSFASLYDRSFGREEGSSYIDNPKSSKANLEEGGQRHEGLCPNVSYRQPLAFLLGFSLAFAAVPVGINMRGRDRGPVIAAAMFLVSFCVLNWGVWELLRDCL